MIRKLSYLLSIALVILCGCRADDLRRVEPPVSSDGTTLQLLIPSTGMARETGARKGSSLTRSENHGTASTAENEGAINSLHLIGFYYDAMAENAKKHFYIELDPKAADNQVEGIYNCYNLDIEDGDYHLYLLANINISALESYGLSDNDADASALETAVNGLTILGGTVSADDLDYTKAGKGLPMAWKDNISVKKGVINKATANLEFCVAKVRLTLLFDNKDFSAGYGANAELKINATDALNVYSTTRVFEPKGNTDKYSGNVEKVENVGIYGHYELPASCDPEDLVKTDYSLDNLKAKEAPSGQIAYQVTCYLPECIAARLGDGMPGTSLVSIPEGEAIEQIEIQLGCKDPESKDLTRGHYYDIVGRMNSARQVELSWNILPWSVESLAVQLSGDTELNLGETVIKSLDGSETRKIAYSTTAPRVTFESDKDENGKPIFILSANAADNVINVQVNPELGVRTGENSKLKEKGFYVVAGNIRKRVDVKEVDLSAFLRLLPESQTLYAKQIANQASYDMYMDYASNMSSLKLVLTEYNNGNVKPEASTPASDSDLKFYATICGADSVAISKPIRLATDKELSASSLWLEDTKSLPKGGFIRISVIDPIDQEYFGKSIRGTVTATATEGSQTLTKKSEFKIMPSAQFYTIHFKAINGEKWNNPHVYIYQNLEYDDRLVMKKNPKSEWKLNYVEYNFSCGHSFKGWKPWGAAEVPTYEDKTYYLDSNQQTYECDWGEESYGASGRYDTGVDFFHDYRVDEKRNKCTYCRNAIPSGFPGIQMEKEDNDWWKLEIPLIAKPGKTLIMFKEGHDDKGTTRYPGNEIPGVVMPNYGDCEAWFLLDKNQGSSWEEAGKSCYFTDDRNEGYPEKPEEVKKSVTLRYKSSITDKTQIHLFISEEHKLTTWQTGNTELKDGYRYLRLEVPEGDCTLLNNLDGTFKFIIHTNNDKYEQNEITDFIFNNTDNNDSGKVKKLDSSSMPEGYQSDYCFELFGENTITPEPEPEYTYSLKGPAFDGWNTLITMEQNGDTWEWNGTIKKGDFGIVRKEKGNNNDEAFISSDDSNHDISGTGTYNATINGNNWNSTIEGKATLSFNAKTMELTVSYDNGGSVTDDYTHFLIAWPTSFGGDRFYLFDKSTDIRPFGDWNNDSNKESWKATWNDIEYYFKWGSISDLKGTDWSLDAGWRYCVINNDSNKKDNQPIESSTAQYMTDIPDAVVNAIGGNAKIKAIVLKQ